MHSKGQTLDYPPIEKSTCAAVVSSYNPPEGLIARIRDLLEQFLIVVLVDDGSVGDGNILRECARAGAITVESADNAGIAAALNRGVREIGIREPAAAYVVTFDQDSSPPAGLLERYRVALDAAVGDGLRVGMVCPGTIDESPIPFETRDRDYLEVFEPIQSGTLIPLRILEQIGGFDESLFIDGVDTDAYWRLRTAGYTAIAAPGVALEHTLGSRSAAALFGHEFRLNGESLLIMQSAAFRYYYLVRNRCVLVRRYWYRYPAAMARGAFLDLRHLAVVLVLGSGKRTRMAFALKGLVHGIRGVGGRLDAPQGSDHEGRTTDE